uniref:Uncharacterized protein n=1 Tax=Romanomermis culicivorax TaxID=13658 RepID=A0A915HK65_ROMCU
MKTFLCKRYEIVSNSFSLAITYDWDRNHFGIGNASLNMQDSRIRSKSVLDHATNHLTPATESCSTFSIFDVTVGAKVMCLGVLDGFIGDKYSMGDFSLLFRSASIATLTLSSKFNGKGAPIGLLKLKEASTNAVNCGQILSNNTTNPAIASSLEIAPISSQQSLASIRTDEFFKSVIRSSPVLFFCAISFESPFSIPPSNTSAITDCMKNIIM